MAGSFNAMMGGQVLLPKRGVLLCCTTGVRMTLCLCPCHPLPMGGIQACKRRCRGLE
jgi:hypothetical protein